ncbi:MAG TPA: hypothetical protein PLO69_11115 [Gammaproteobacteria bacterium]|nr:hypothetical protein [Gammaproteobacteria bacterium]
MTTTIVTINQTDVDHLAHVTEQMRALGSPTIRAIRDEAQGVIVALEGSHRLAAAKALGLTPRFVMLTDDDMISCEDIGYDDSGWFEGEPARAGAIRERLAQPMGMYSGCPIIDFTDVEIA